MGGTVAKFHFGGCASTSLNVPKEMSAIPGSYGLRSR